MKPTLEFRVKSLKDSILNSPDHYSTAWSNKVGTAPSANYNNEYVVCGFSLHLVGCGGGKWGLAKVNALREPHKEVTLQVKSGVRKGVIRCCARSLDPLRVLTLSRALRLAQDVLREWDALPQGDDPTRGYYLFQRRRSKCYNKNRETARAKECNNE